MQAGDHLFVSHATLVNYGHAKLYDNVSLDAALSGGEVNLLERIRDGAKRSPHFRLGHLELLAQQGLVVLES